MPSEQEARAGILQSIFVRKENVVVPTTVRDIALSMENLLADYVKGKINLYGFKINRSTEQVIEEIKNIHEFPTKQKAKDFICASAAMVPWQSLRKPAIWTNAKT